MPDADSGFDSSRRQLLKLLGLGAIMPGTGLVGARESTSTTPEPTVTSTSAKTGLDDVIVVEEETASLGPGVTFTAFSHLHADGWVAGRLLELDTSVEELSTDLLSPGLTATDTVSTLVADAGATCGINGDFFHLGATNAPLGSEFTDGRLVKSSDHAVQTSFAVDEAGVGHVLDVVLDGTVSLPNEEVDLAGLNPIGLPPGGIGVFTADWGETTRGHAVSGAGDVTEVTVQERSVVSTSNEANGEGSVAEETVVFVGRGSGAATLGDLSTGDSVSVEFSPASGLGASLDHGLSGNAPLVRNGRVNAGLTDSGDEPRTAIGIADGGRTLLLLTVDGRQRRSRGLSYPRLADYMAAFGAEDALNLDGGGSTTMVARRRGRQPVVQNSPSGGDERAVTNGIGVFLDGSAGSLTEFVIEAERDAADPPRLFSGLTRDFVAYGHDEVGDPVNRDPGSWTVQPDDRASVDGQGVVTGEAPGAVSLAVERDGATGELDAVVLNELVQVNPDPRRMGLVAAGDSAEFAVWGRDEDGHRVPIEPRDVDVSVDEDVVSVDETDEGTLVAIAETGDGTTTIEVTVDGVTTEIPVVVGTDEEPVDEFEDPAAWDLAVWPPEVDGAIDFADDRDGQVLRLSYDFTTTEATRAAYAVAGDPVELPDGADRIGLWVDGDGHGVWLRGRLEDASGIEYTVDFADPVDWEGWEHVDASVPSAAVHPVSVKRIYAVETQATAQYAGELGFDELTAISPRSIDPARRAPRADPLIVQHGGVERDGPVRFAAISGGAIGSDDGRSEELARRALGDIAAADPDFLVICGNFAARGTEESLSAATDLIEAELGGSVPVHYVPGTSERKDDPALETFTDIVGDPRATFEHGGTRFVLLNSSTGSLRTADFPQLVDLDDALADDADAERLVVLAHHAVTDPFAIETGLDDEKEADFVRSRLAEAARDSETEVAYLSGRGDPVSVDRYDGVPHVAVGTIDADIEAVRDQGDARVWLEVATGADRLRAAVHPLFTNVSIDVSPTIEVGETVDVAATGSQEGAPDVPIAYPLTARWTGSENLFVGSGDEAAQARESGDYVAILDPVAGNLEGVADGEVTVTIETNGMSAEAMVQIGDPADDGGDPDDRQPAPGLIATMASVAGASYLWSRLRANGDGSDEG